MKSLLTLLAVGCLALALATPASAQYFPPGYGGNTQYVPGIGYNYNYNSNFNRVPGLGYNYNWNSGYNYGPSNYGHIDIVPGGLIQHRNHYHSVQPHVDYHIGNRRYEVLPTPYGPVVSPFPHRHH